MRRYALITLVIFLSQNSYSRMCTEKDFIENTIHLCNSSESNISGASTFTKENLYNEYQEDLDQKNEYDDVWPYSADLCNVNQVTGPTYKSYSLFENYHYYRYVTTYKVIKSKTRAPFPIFREECHDDSWRFGSFNKRLTTKTTVETSLNIEVIGLKIEVSEEHTIEFDRGVRATYGVVANHVPYIYSEKWVGTTQIQTYNKNTGKVEFLDFKFPFKVNGLNPIFVVERNVLQVYKKCPLNY